MPDPESVLVPIKRSLRWLMAATVAIYLALVVFGVVTFMNASTNRDALCALRHDLETRVEVAEKFLEENPKGTLGLPAPVIRTSIHNQQQTIKALSNLSCDTVLH